MMVSARATACLGRQARAIGGEPVDQVADARIARVAHRFERLGVRQRGGSVDVGQGRAGKVGRERLELAACVFERVQLIEEKGVRPRSVGA